MRILIIDGQGGGIGARLVGLLRPRLPEGCELLCAGTNSLATSAMLKAGAARGATGEHAPASGDTPATGVYSTPAERSEERRVGERV